eukprot:1157437-Pelagomonas_calceolata.AAC.14
MFMDLPNKMFMDSASIAPNCETMQSNVHINVYFSSYKSETGATADGENDRQTKKISSKD